MRVVAIGYAPLCMLTVGLLCAMGSVVPPAAEVSTAAVVVTPPSSRDCDGEDCEAGKRNSSCTSKLFYAAIMHDSVLGNFLTLLVHEAMRGDDDLIVRCSWFCVLCRLLVHQRGYGRRSHAAFAEKIMSGGN
ncbi:hypothetical protein FOZ61_001908 [Perkinsus olseni]|uniref:Secreted protein n=1 Tax=Perkinsus olseni TaxID=32597 RepID=A0A7J6MEQ9_PEROL|nr:hypothetical protein FOZ61_001908 [Perkinsus olseni]